MNYSMSPEPWEKLSSVEDFTCRIFSVHRRAFRHAGRRRERDFFVIDAPDWVNILALTPERRLVMISQYRFGIESLTWEIPGGAMDPGESPVTAALRELMEETGYSGERARVLGSVHPNPAILSNRCHLVLVEGVKPTGETAWDGDEEIGIREIEPDEVFRWASNGRITHSLVLNALLLLKLEEEARSG